MERLFYSTTGCAFVKQAAATKGVLHWSWICYYKLYCKLFYLEQFLCSTSGYVILNNIVFYYTEVFQKAVQLAVLFCIVKWNATSN